MKSFYTSNQDFAKFLAAIIEQEWELYSTVKEKDSINFKLISNASEIGNIVFGSVRANQPFKSFFFNTREQVASLPKTEVNPVKFKNRLVLNIKECDLHALKVFDKAYYEEGSIPEPFYKERREKTFLASSDCGYSIDSCFCTVVGGTPYPREGFDINLSQVKGGFVIEVANEKGEQLLKEIKKAGALVQTPQPYQIEEQKSNRRELTKKIEEANKEFEVPKKYDELCKKGLDAQVWKDLTDKKCVQCNGCLNICPTCYCFLLYDKNKDGIMERMRVWDACINSGYARVAGGASPRPTLASRLRHRFFHKFLYYYELFGMYACSGCGRCANVCPGKIEIRQTFKDMSKEKTGAK